MYAYILHNLIMYCDNLILTVNKMSEIRFTVLVGSVFTLTLVGGNHVLAQIFKDNHRDWREESRVCWAMGGKFLFSCNVCGDVNASHTSNFFIRSQAGRFWIKVRRNDGNRIKFFLRLFVYCILMDVLPKSIKQSVDISVIYITNKQFMEMISEDEAGHSTIWV